MIIMTTIKATIIMATKLWKMNLPQLHFWMEANLSGGMQGNLGPQPCTAPAVRPVPHEGHPRPVPAQPTAVVHCTGTQRSSAFRKRRCTGWMAGMCVDSHYRTCECGWDGAFDTQSVRQERALGPDGKSACRENQEKAQVAKKPTRQK